MFAIRERGARGTTTYELIGTVAKRVEDRIDLLRKDPKALAGLPTGFVELDRRTQGLHPGDLVIADGSGVVFIPREKEQEVIKEAEAVAQQEARMAEGIRQGLSVVEVLERLGYESMLDKGKGK